MTRIKLGVLISGRGSNLQSLIDACADPEFPAEIAIVVSNRPRAAGLTRAKEAGLQSTVIDHTTFDDRDAFDDALSDALSAAGGELVCLVGLLRLLQEKFVRDWRDRVINIHPSLLPAFRGLDVHERVLEAGVRITGCTVHYVRATVDDGPIVIQGAVPVMPDDTAKTLAARVLEAEHVIYPEAVRLIGSGQARLRGDRISFDQGFEAPHVLIHPPAGPAGKQRLNETAGLVRLQEAARAALKKWRSDGGT